MMILFLIRRVGPGDETSAVWHVWAEPSEGFFKAQIHWHLAEAIHHGQGLEVTRGMERP